MKINKVSLIENINNEILLAANEQSKLVQAKDFKTLRIQSGIISACTDLKYQIENGDLFKNVSLIKEYAKCESETYKKMSNEVPDYDPWKQYYQGKSKGYEMIAKFMSEKGE